jgi:hypothetical protein
MTEDQVEDKELSQHQLLQMVEQEIHLLLVHLKEIMAEKV